MVSARTAIMVIVVLGLAAIGIVALAIGSTWIGLAALVTAGGYGWGTVAAARRELRGGEHG
jgi:hypothetical protein